LTSSSAPYVLEGINDAFDDLVGEAVGRGVITFAGRP
jgi:hypothetical protein